MAPPESSDPTTGTSPSVETEPPPVVKDGAAVATPPTPSRRASKADAPVVEGDPFAPTGDYLDATIETDEDGDGYATVGIFPEDITAIANEDGTDASGSVSIMAAPGTVGITGISTHGDPNTSTTLRIYYDNKGVPHV